MKKQDLLVLSGSKFHGAKLQIVEPKDILHRFHADTSYSDLPTNNAFQKLTVYSPFTGH
jgi:hypothetical protein